MEQTDLHKPELKKTLLEIFPRELKFSFEVKKQSTCSVCLTNVTDDYVAFKVKTTSPKKYCVRPNIGVIKPKTSFDFSVTMQAQRVVPSELACKDKFLIQSTVAPFGTTEDYITSDMFAKEGGKYVEDSKLKVSLVIATPPATFSLANEVPRQQSPLAKTEDDRLLTGGDNYFSAPNKNPFEENFAKDSEISTPGMLKSNDEVASKSLNDVELMTKKLSRDIDELMSKITTLDSDLVQANSNITKLTEERNGASHENQTLKEECVMLRRKMGARIVERGFPALYVCMVALTTFTIGFLLHGC